MSGLTAKDLADMVAPWKEAVRAAMVEVEATRVVLRAAEDAVQAARRAVARERAKLRTWQAVAVAQLCGVAGALATRMMGLW